MPWLMFRPDDLLSSSSKKFLFFFPVSSFIVFTLFLHFADGSYCVVFWQNVWNETKNKQNGPFFLSFPIPRNLYTSPECPDDDVDEEEALWPDTNDTTSSPAPTQPTSITITTPPHLLLPHLTKPCRSSRVSPSRLRPAAISPLTTCSSSSSSSTPPPPSSSATTRVTTSTTATTTTTSKASSLHVRRPALLKKRWHLFYLFFLVFFLFSFSNCQFLRVFLFSIAPCVCVIVFANMCRRRRSIHSVFVCACAVIYVIVIFFFKQNTIDTIKQGHPKTSRCSSGVRPLKHSAHFVSFSFSFPFFFLYFFLNLLLSWLLLHACVLRFSSFISLTSRLKWLESLAREKKGKKRKKRRRRRVAPVLNPRRLLSAAAAAAV